MPQRTKNHTSGPDPLHPQAHWSYYLAWSQIQVSFLFSRVYLPHQMECGPGACQKPGLGLFNQASVFLCLQLPDIKGSGTVLYCWASFGQLSVYAEEAPVLAILPVKTQLQGALFPKSQTWIGSCLSDLIALLLFLSMVGFILNWLHTGHEYILAQVYVGTGWPAVAAFVGSLVQFSALLLGVILIPITGIPFNVPLLLT